MSLLAGVKRRLKVSQSPDMPAKLTGAYFAAPVCRNCGVELSTRYCPVCGQEKAARFQLRDLGAEAWEKLRWFEGSLVSAGLRVAFQPGLVARDYVLGARKSHVHPFKLLLASIVALLLVIYQVDYLGSSNETLNRAIALVQTYSKWSFSLGIVAVLAASSLVFWRRRGFNFVEHLVLATYTHFVILLANIVNLSPLLVHSTPELVKQHRAVSGWYMNWVEAGIVFLAFTQFFAVDWRRRWWQPAIGAAVYFLIKKGLLYLYARAVIRIVLAQIA